jgi:hypothetical protein
LRGMRRPQDPFEALKPGIRIGRLTIGTPLLTILMAASVVMGAVIVQTVLQAPFVTPFEAVISENCDPVAPTPATVQQGTDGFIQWACGPEAAFSVVVEGTVTPTITAGLEWTSTYIYRTNAAGPTTSCATAVVNRLLVSGTPVTFTASDVAGWNYCSDFVNAQPGMTDVEYSWDQA